jgi:hypothetical protein
VQNVFIPGTGHWVPEQAHEQMLAALTAFPGPVPQLTDRGHDPGRMLAPVLIGGKRQTREDAMRLIHGLET